MLGLDGIEVYIIMTLRDNARYFVQLFEVYNLSHYLNHTSSLYILVYNL